MPASSARRRTINDSAAYRPQYCFQSSSLRFWFRSTGAVGEPRAVHARPQSLGDTCTGEMETIKPGMTRADLLKVFTSEGGLPPKGLQGLRRTFVSRDCPYFKIAVEFEPVARLDPRNTVFLTSIEDSRDIIVKVSRPYLQFAD